MYCRVNTVLEDYLVGLLTSLMGYLRQEIEIKVFINHCHLSIFYIKGGERQINGNDPREPYSATLVYG